MISLEDLRQSKTIVLKARSVGISTSTWWHIDTACGVDKTVLRHTTSRGSSIVDVPVISPEEFTSRLMKYVDNQR